MVQVIQDFLVTIIGDLYINDNFTLMELISYLITLALMGFLIVPIFSLFKGRCK